MCNYMVCVFVCARKKRKIIVEKIDIRQIWCLVVLYKLFNFLCFREIPFATLRTFDAYFGLFVSTLSVIAWKKGSENLISCK